MTLIIVLLNVVLFIAHCHHVFLGMLIIMLIKKKIKNNKKKKKIFYHMTELCGKLYYGSWPPCQHLDVWLMTWLWHWIYNNAPCFGAFVPNRVFQVMRLSAMKVHMLLDYILLLMLQDMYQFIVHTMKGSCKVDQVLALLLQLCLRPRKQITTLDLNPYLRSWRL